MEPVGAVSYTHLDVYKRQQLGLCEIIELKRHPFFLGVQFHPEFKSRPDRPHPLFREFIGAAIQHSRNR